VSSESVNSRPLQDEKGTRSSANPQPVLRPRGATLLILSGMRNLLMLFVLLIPLSLLAGDRELSLAREMLDDAIIRNDADGMQLARERLLRIAAEADNSTVMRDAHYLAGLSALFESFSGVRDAGASARIVTAGIRQADRAIEIDPRFADGWTLSGLLRTSAQRLGQPLPKDPPGTPNRFAHAAELDPKSSATAFFMAMGRSINPNGAAPPEGVKMFDDLAARLDADRAATGRRFGLWDAQAHAWTILVRMAQDEPSAETLRAMAARLLAQRPDFAQAQQLAEGLADHRFVAAPAVTWQPFLTDAAGDGKNPKLPDVIAVDRAENGDRVWYRVTFHDPLPRSFGVNLVVNRNGDPATGMKWWGNGSTFRFDRLVTAWISRDGDRYFGRIGITDDNGARTAHLASISTDVLLAMADDNRSVMVGVPRAVLGLTDASTMVVAGGSHLLWNDDATSAANSR
jgi:hypothetical protein